MTYDKPIIRTIHPETRIIDAANGIVDYIASDETIDSYREIVKVDGWRFNRFRKNAPFVDSHDYYCIDKLLGRVLSWRIERSDEGRPQLIERVRWAKDVEENTLARLGWKMTEAGYLKAVSVGFQPLKWLTPWSDPKDFAEELGNLGVEPEQAINAIFLEHEQLELSACIIGANPEAVARAYKGGAIGDEDVDRLGKLFREQDESLRARHSQQFRQPASASSAQEARAADEAVRERRAAFLRELDRRIHQ